MYGTPPEKSLRLYGTEKLCSEFGEDRFINNVTFLSNDADRTDGRTFTWFYADENVSVERRHVMQPSALLCTYNNR